VAARELDLFGRQLGQRSERRAGLEATIADQLARFEPDPLELGGVGSQQRVLGRVAVCVRGREDEPAGPAAGGLGDLGDLGDLLKVWPALWTFVEAEGVEPTNNAAERGLRHAVIYRRLSQGSRSEQGKRTTERLLSAAITCRLQRRSLFAYLTEVAAASIRGQPAPALA
jgi:hypothetical protein